MKSERWYAGRTLILRLMGVAGVLIGFVAAFLGPVEMFCFYLFSEGGVFHYEGFGFGSFMFGNIAAQIIGYYFIAVFLIPIGYGTVRLQGWARHLTLAALRFWIVAGLPLIAAFFFVLISSKEPALSVVILVGILLVVAYLVLPGLALRFYNHPDTRQIFKTHGVQRTWIETIPIPVLGLSYVALFFIVVLYVHIFFNGIFPLFGIWCSGLEGIILLDLSMLLLLVLLWGTMRVKPWAWWGMLVYFCLMTFSYLTTLLASSWAEILAALNLPAFEQAFLQGIPLQGCHFAILAGMPFLLTIGLIVRSRSYFNRGRLAAEEMGNRSCLREETS